MNPFHPHLTCQRCGGELAAQSHGSHFGEGECRQCEFIRYRTQPELLRLTVSLRNASEDRISILREERSEGLGDPDDIQAQIDHWTVLLNRCEQALEAATAGLHHQDEGRS